MSNNSDLSDDQAAAMKRVQDVLDAATKQFEDAVEEGGVGNIISAFGKMMSGVGDASDEFGDGLGDTLEKSVQKAFGSEEVGSSTVKEVGEGFFGIVGELTEAVAEIGGGVGEIPAKLVGGVVTTVGDVVENLGDAGSQLLDGNVGEAIDQGVDAVKSLWGLAETAVDTGGAVVKAAGEVVEGVIETGVEVVEAGAEIVVGAARDIGGVAEDAYDLAADGLSALGSGIAGLFEDDEEVEVPVLDLSGYDEPVIDPWNTPASAPNQEWGTDEDSYSENVSYADDSYSENVSYAETSSSDDVASSDEESFSDY